MLALVLQFLFGDHSQGTIEIVDAFYEVFGEFLNGEVFCCLNVALGSLLEIAVFGYLAEVFVL